MHALGQPHGVSKKPYNRGRTARPSIALENNEPSIDYEIVDLDLTMFRGIGKNHQRSFERNMIGRNQTLAETCSVMLSVNEDWKSFALNNRKVSKDHYETETHQPKQRLIYE
jgi:hypothetical protein